MQDTHQFSGIDAAKWQRIKDQVKAKVGVDISSDVGDATAKGIELSWSYNAATLDLSIALVKREWFDPSQTEIDTDLDTWIPAA